jgi:hypothetical protein
MMQQQKGAQVLFRSDGCVLGIRSSMGVCMKQREVAAAAEGGSRAAMELCLGSVHCSTMGLCSGAAWVELLL